jgi:peptidyl-prolyl cis-trans isomerase B (cyclophilin B)
MNSKQLMPAKAGDTVATMHTNYGDIKILMLPEYAPKTVENFVTHAKNGYYDNLTFHRVIDNFMIQGGDPTGTGMGGPNYKIKGEFTANGFKNDLKHTRGVISMARSMDKDSAGSQFFIMHEDSPHLDGQYASFGKVIEGMDVVDEIANCDVDWSDRPLKDVIMKKVTVETFGVEYANPIKA